MFCLLVVVENMNKTLEQSYNWLWEAYGKPEGKSEDIFHQLKNLNEQSLEYQQKMLLYTQLSRLEKLQTAIKDQRHYIIRKNEQIDKLRGENDKQRSIIDRIREDASEPPKKASKSDQDRIDELNDNILERDRKILQLQQSRKPKIPKSLLQKQKVVLQREIAHMEFYITALQQEKVLIEEAIPKILNRELVDEFRDLKPFLQTSMYMNPQKSMGAALMTRLISALNKLEAYWSQKNNLKSKTNVEAIHYYLKIIIPNIAALELKENEKMYTLKEKVQQQIEPMLASKREKLLRIDEDLLFYEQNPELVNSCLTCGETRRSMLRRERNNPSRVFCGKMCQNKFYN